MAHHLTPAELADASPQELRAMLIDEAVREAAQHGHTPNGVANFWVLPDGEEWVAVALIPIVAGQS